MFARHFEYYTIILRGGVFFRGHAVLLQKLHCWRVTLYCVCRSSGCTANICERRVSARHWSIRSSICCCWSVDFVTVKTKRWQWSRVWEPSRRPTTSRVHDSVHSQGSAVQPGPSLPSGGLLLHLFAISFDFRRMLIVADFILPFRTSLRVCVIDCRQC